MSTRSKMDQLKGHHVCLLLILLLFTAVAGKDISSFSLKIKDKATLPCENVIKDQNKCDRTSWLFTHTSVRPTVELVHLGQIAKAKSNKLGITEDCSLVIKEVTSKDTGQYVCRQFTKSNEQGLFSLVHLSVISIGESGVPGVTDYHCVVHGKCAHTVKWIYRTNTTAIKTEDTDCSSTVSFQTAFPVVSIWMDSLYCNVTDQRNGQTLLCNRSTCVLAGSKGDLSAGNRTVEDGEIQTKAGNCPESKPVEDDAPTKAAWFRMSAFCVGLMVLIMIVVMVNVWIRTKGKKTRRNHSAVQNDDDDGMYDSVLYENPEGLNATVRLGRSKTNM
ncbi:uncharacterized protein LOC121521726 [Cheilinus undulatus]|uniref:uncharacterized protein LOC121521726 n=1 Tax=Cheilinus undulatus TaxID=241271 RepID=UPI001BD26451|nr:uncharacterized protein LOC121521726 [Cheilinus undulatus]